MLIDRIIPNLWGGVSQQPDGLRQDNQAAEVLNGWGSIIRGLKVRPNSEFVQFLQDYNFQVLPKIHVINRDSTERYIVVFTGNSSNPLRVYTLDGDECTVRYGKLDTELGYVADLTVKNYLNYTSTPRDAFKATTIADYTILTNKEVKCRPSGVLENEWNNSALIYVKKAIAKTRYTVTINGVTVYSYYANTDYLNAGDLVDAISAGIATQLGDGWTTVRFPSSFYWSEPETLPPSTLGFTLALDATPASFVALRNSSWGGFGTYSENYDAARTCAEFETWLNTNFPGFEWTRAGYTFFIRKIGGGAYTSSISNNMIGAYFVAGGTPSQWNITRLANTNVIHLRRFDGGAFSISAVDEYDNNSLISIQGKVQKITELPTRAPEGYYVEVTGDETNSYGRYYLKFNTEDGMSQGTWEEVGKKGLDNSFNASTLPHRLVRTGALEFTFAPCDWDKRVAGDENSSPAPSFINKTCSDVFMYKDRLGFLSGENVILSRSGDYFNFWRGTALELLDDDPIDIGVASEQVATLNHAIAMQSTLILSSDIAQYSLGSGDQPLTPKTVAFDPITRFAASRVCRPVGIGPNVYLPSPVGNFSRIREYFVTPDTLLTDAADVTAHVPQYVPKDVTVMFASTPHELLFVLSSADTHSMWVYATFWQGDEKVQSAWMKWNFGDAEILGGEVLDNLLILVMKRGTKVYLEKVDLEDITHLTVGGKAFRLSMDCLAQATFTGFHQVTPTTSGSVFSCPFLVSEETLVVDADTGKKVPFRLYDANSILIIGDWSGKTLKVGFGYRMEYTFSQFVVKSEKSNVDVFRGSLQLRNLRLHFENTGYFRVEVKVNGRPVRSKTFSPATLGATDPAAVPLAEGYLQFPILSNARQVEVKVINDSHLPSTFQYASWKGTYNKNSRSL